MSPSRFQLLLRRHSRRMGLKALSKKIDFSVEEIDDVELGKKHAKFDTCLALLSYFKLPFTEEELRKTFRLK